MTENTTISDPLIGSSEPAIKSLETVENTLAELFDTASVTRAYGEPIQNGQTTIVPAAEVLTLVGFGIGYGSGEEGDDPEVSGGRGGGGAAGGGGRTFSRPIAVIVASPDGVRMEPVVDVTKIALAALTAAGFMIATLFGMLRPERLLRRLEEEG